MDVTPPDFWTTLKNAGVNAATNIAAPISSGITKGFSNLVQTGQNKVAVVAQTIIKTTDPNKPAASQPATPPTTATPPASNPITPGNVAFGVSSATILVILGLVALFFFLRKK